MARQRFCGARLLMERAPVFLNFGLGGKFSPITPQALKPFFFTPNPRGPGEEGCSCRAFHDDQVSAILILMIWCIQDPYIRDGGS